MVFGTALDAIRVTILFRTIKLQPSNAMYHIWYAIREALGGYVICYFNTPNPNKACYIVL